MPQERTLFQAGFDPVVDGGGGGGGVGGVGVGGGGVGGGGDAAGGEDGDLMIGY